METETKPKVIVDKPEQEKKEVKKDLNTLYDESIKLNNDLKKNLVRTSAILRNQVAFNLKPTFDLILDDIETLHSLEFGDDKDKEKEKDLRIMSGQTLVDNFNLLVNDICRFKTQSFEFFDENKDFYVEE